MIKLNKTKKNTILIIILVISIITLSVSFGFFVVQIATPANTDINVTTSKSESLKLTPGADINLVASIENFSSGHGTLSASTTSTAKLTANSSAGSASDKYNVYFNINNNNYLYTQSTDIPEILLKIISPTNEEVTSITGLTHKTVLDKAGVSQSGFDITTVTGMFTIANNYTIETTDSVTGITHNWEAEVIFINHDADQSSNTGKTLNSTLILSQDTNTVENNCIGDKMAQCLSDNSNMIPSLIKHDPGLLNSTEDGNYRYSGGNDVVHNYVCFGSDDEICPDDNMYRILGIYENKIKLIKNTPIDYNLNNIVDNGDQMRYHTSSNNLWEGTDVNNVSDDAWSNNYLNTTFYDTFGEKYKSMIIASTYNINELTHPTTGVAQDVYEDEVQAQTVSTYNIAIMNAYDYLYAAAPNLWNLKQSEQENNTEYKDNNWMFINQFEWTITPYASNGYIHPISSSGAISGGYSVTNSLYIRPVFYLKSEIILKSGSGAEENPFRIDI